MPKISKYSGETNFNSYEVQFNAYATQAELTEDEKLTSFAILLKEKALDYYVNRAHEGGFQNVQEVFRLFRRRLAVRIYISHYE